MLVQQGQCHLGLHLRKTMVKLAKLFFLIFSAASPKPFLLNNNSSMDMEVNPNTSPVVLIKSNILPIKTNSFSTKLNPLPIKHKLPTYKESWKTWVAFGLLAVELTGIAFCLFVILVVLVIGFCRVPPKDQAV